VATVGAGAATPLSKRADQLIIAGLVVALAVVPAAFVPQLYDDFTLIKQSGLVVAAGLVLAGLAMVGFPFPASRPVRIAFGSWLALLVLAELLAIDPRGSALGVYQYRQGFVTQLAYVVLFLGGARVQSRGGRLFERSLLLGGAAVLFYTAVQALGRDPVEWWTDTSRRAIGTIGNANELAAFAVIALTCLPAALSLAGRRTMVLGAAIAAAVAFIVLQSESRSGLGALALYLALVPVSWFVGRNPWTALLRPGAAVIAGFAAGAVLSLAAGSLPDTAERVHGGVVGADAGGSTRFALWKGTLTVIEAEPLHGAGPDGLFLSFPVHRPADLGGAFESYDLVAQSSHNLVLDTAANYGLPALAALVALVGLASANSVRQARERSGGAVSSAPWTWSALAAYGALTLLNPVSLAPQAAFFVALGMLAADGQTAQVRRTAAVSPALRLVAVAPALMAALFLAVRLPLADYRANEGWDDYAAKRFDAAAGNYDRASSAMPLERRYASDHARALLAAGVAGPPARLNEADEAFISLDERFGLTSGDAVGQATARLGLKRDAAEINPLIDRAVRLNPHGVFMEAYANRLRLAVAQGAILHYSDRDRWVFVEPAPPPESTFSLP
jgi:O-antigen ligase